MKWKDENKYNFIALILTKTVCVLALCSTTRHNESKPWFSVGTHINFYIPDSPLCHPKLLYDFLLWKAKEDILKNCFVFRQWKSMLFGYQVFNDTRVSKWWKTSEQIWEVHTSSRDCEVMGTECQSVHCRRLLVKCDLSTIYCLQH